MAEQDCVKEKRHTRAWRHRRFRKNAAAALFLLPGLLGVLLFDQNTAASIFGTSQTSSQYLWISGEAYQVCATFESEFPTVIRNAAASDENALTQAVLKASSQDKDNLSGKAEQFLMRHSLSGTVVSIDHLTVFVGDLLLLVPLALIGRLTGTIMKEKDSRSRRKEDGFARGDAGLLIISAFVTFWLAFHYFEIPSDMVPTRWSDFSFWGAWLEEQKKNVLLLLTTPLGKVQAQILWNCLTSLTCTLAAAFLALL
ncbi:MAG: hypothetical protein LUF35_05155 [Lachnospiraceae bacterium]|nr:hypothetical protein [Lachnospiraceae bacterium]